MNYDIIDGIAIRVLEIWLLIYGFKLSGDYEIMDYGPHRVWTVSACCEGQILAEDFWMLLTDYLHNSNQLYPAFCQFQPYEVNVYPDAVGGTSNIYVSIYN